MSVTVGPSTDTVRSSIKSSVFARNPTPRRTPTQNQMMQDTKNKPKETGQKRKGTQRKAKQDQKSRKDNPKKEKTGDEKRELEDNPKT